MISGIYTLTNQINGKIYVGQSVDIERRFKRHKRELFQNKHSNLHLQRAYNLGQQFDYKIELNCEKQDLAFYEIWYIASYDTQNTDKGYNMGMGGTTPMLGKHFSIEHKRKLSESKLGIKNPFYGKDHSKEVKEKWLISRPKGENNPSYNIPKSQEHINKISGLNHYNYGKHLSEEHKIKIRKSSLGKINSKEAINKMILTKYLKKQKERHLFEITP